MTDGPHSPALRDPARLAALAAYGMMATPREAAFDDLAALAARLLRTPFALVTLVDAERQWFKAHVGTDIETVPNEVGFCPWTVAQGTRLIVPDTAQDSRFQANGVVCGPPNLRFYAGEPLITPEGFVIGALCVIDTVPHPQGLSDEEQETLAVLARQVVAQFELRRRAAESEHAALASAAQADQLRVTSERYHTLFNSIDEGFCVIEILWNEAGKPVDYRFLEINAAFAKHTGLQDALGRTARELIPGHEEFWYETYGHVARTGEAVRADHQADALGRFFDVYAFRLGGAQSAKVAVLFTDTTERHRAEEEVARLGAESRARLAEMETLLEVIPVGIGIALDRECRNIRLNPAFAHVLGLAARANGSLTASDGDRPANFRCLDDDGREVPGAELPMQVAARDGIEQRGRELNVVHEDGRTVRLLEYAVPLFDDAGTPRGAVGAFVDITERRQAEERNRFLVQLDDAVRPLSDPAEIVAAAARLLGEHVHADRCAYADVEADEDTFNLTGDFCRGVPSIVGHYTFTQFGSAALRHMRANEPYVVQDIEAEQLPTEILESYRATLIRAVICVPLHKRGKFVAAMAVHQTTPRSWTEEESALLLHVANRCWEAIQRVQVARELGESEARFRALVEASAQIVWTTDANGLIIEDSPSWRAFTGQTTAQWLGTGWLEAIHPDDRARTTESWREANETQSLYEVEYRVRHVDGGWRWTLARGTPQLDGAGKVRGWVGMNSDVHEQRSAAEALALAKEQAEEASRAKDDFLAALSHELRTPLTPVLMTAAALQEDESLPAEVRPQLAMMRRNIELEARLIDDLLDLTRITRGKLGLRAQACEAQALLRLAWEIVREEAQAKGLVVKFELAEEPAHLFGDPTRLQQVFWNLLKNAVKFTPRGGSIVVSASAENGRAVVKITDTGIGIAPEALERIFRPFDQAGRANDHRFGGLGLGLSISKAIVELHAGELRAASAGPDRGATFRVDLPSAPRPDETPLDHSPAPISPSAPAVLPLRLLLVEDHEPTLGVLARMLTRDGHTVATASNLTEARAAAERGTFDAVVSDIGLPDGTGLDLMRELRASQGLRGVALSGYGMEADLSRSHEAGFITHLIKPVDFAQLRRALTAFGTRAPGDKSLPSRSATIR